ncbi:hypothetical protein H4696_006188 [Amycolatopsis lexingtonensis]|uniref:DUF3558 domain-containing protein n=1 Tax=Amycolatopsis lexingtonensis TaxID=218822 RepID=A0ABR9I7F6_9PSEU|nr:hypothetical protein [Amycolatopsis lexingtonensis]MBE1499088.1 hypothetical protein [Amycolatopsis lexingtonensis]
MSSLRQLAGALLACLLVSSGCAGETSEATRHAPSSVPWHPKRSRPADRDEKVVDAALAALDLCTLIDLGVYDRRKAPGSAPVARQARVFDGRRQCELLRDGFALITVRDEPPETASLRNDGAIVDLASVKGYQTERRVNGQVVGCSVLVPVSFVRAVRFEIAYGAREDDAHCEIVREFATAGARSLPKDLVYPPGGQDSGRIGACANMVVNTDGRDCDPAVDVEVPVGGVDALLDAGARDPNVECAVFRAAVATAFGSAFEPLATPGACWFVEPQHRLQIEAGATASGDQPGIFGSDPNLWTDRQIVTLGKKPAVVFRNLAGNEYSVYASPYGDLGRRGQVRLQISAERERGIDTDGQPALPAEVALKAKAVVASVLEHYFGPGR